MGLKAVAGRFWAWSYDRSLRRGERAGMEARRRALVANARGRVLEIGAGTGLNAAHYPPAGVERLVLTEPDPHMAARLRERAPAAEVVLAGAEDLPFADGSFDTVVCTLVLCTVPDPVAALAEVRRVLAPGGVLLFVEHVRSEDPRVARWQERLWRPWALFAGGCRCHQDTESLIAAAGFAVDAAPERWRAMPALIRPLVVGSARP